jgi:cytochrome b561/polyisoprenoid-binding protein YceI
VRENEYTPTAKLAHWLIAFLIFVQFPLAWVMDDFTGVQKFQAFNLHKSLGLTVLALTALRLIWRLFNPAPALPPSIPERQRMAALIAHALFYLVIFLMVMTGWAMISVSDKPSVFFQFAPFPLLPWLSDLPASDKKAYKDIFEGAHAVLGYALLALIALHLAGALRHAMLKDGIVQTMAPRFGRRSPAVPIAIFLLASAATGLGGAGEARASEWSVKPEQSRIGFEATGSGYTTQGTFGRYKAEIEFDPDEPGQTSVRVLLDMSSAATGEADADQTLRSADFFNPGQFPTAQFVARGAQPAGAGKYVLNGRLTLKGVTRPVALPFSVDINSGTATVNAETKINRLDFGVGPESVAGLAVDKDVKLTINLTAVRLDN